MSRCNAEIGRIGNWHQCPRAATYEAREKFFRFGSLFYCERHRVRAAKSGRELIRLVLS